MMPRAQMGLRNQVPGRRLGLFFLLVFLLAVPSWLLEAAYPVGFLPGLPISALMAICPAAAGLIVVRQEGASPLRGGALAIDSFLISQHAHPGDVERVKP